MLKPYKKKYVVIGKNKVRQLAHCGLLTSLGLAAVPLAKICLPLVVQVHCKGIDNAKSKTTKTLICLTVRIIFSPINHHQSVSRIFGRTTRNMFHSGMVSQEEPFIDMHCCKALQHSLYFPAGAVTSLL